MKYRIVWLLLWAVWLPAGPAVCAQEAEQGDTLAPDLRLRQAVVKGHRSQRLRSRVDNVEQIGRQQLVRAACCNLGESFTASPSVDVAYADAATGARQIRLLGLSGTYVQMLAENVPALRGAALPDALGFVPGPWMQSVQVSKGAAGVKNGYEGTTGQINIEYLKPQVADGVRANGYLDSELKAEGNVDAGIHLNDRLSASLLLHVENRRRSHDGNGDGFADMPRLRQWNAMHRWAYVGPKWVSQLLVRALDDEKRGGQLAGHAAQDGPLYRTDVRNRRYEGQWKNALILSAARNASLALILHGSWHRAEYLFGTRDYDVLQRNGYAQLMYEADVAAGHNLAVGAAVCHDYYAERFLDVRTKPHETTAGLYAQYTWTWADRLTVMPGLRWDRSSEYGAFVTPRLHIRWQTLPWLTLRASAGKGRRTPRPLAENAPLLASGRTVLLPDRLRQEEAWNYGASLSTTPEVAGKPVEINLEYYYTDFRNRLVVNVDGSAGPHTLSFENLQGRSRSHTAQVDVTFRPLEGLESTVAFRWNNVRTAYDGRLREQPLTPRFRGLATLSYTTPLELWRFDTTAQLSGKGTMYDGTAYPTYFLLQAQVTREFPRWAVYAGGENLTGYSMTQPVLHAAHPWAPEFDASQVWGPVSGAMFYVGFRYRLEK